MMQKQGRQKLKKQNKTKTSPNLEITVSTADKTIIAAGGNNAEQQTASTSTSYWTTDQKCFHLCLRLRQDTIPNEGPVSACFLNSKQNWWLWINLRLKCRTRKSRPRRQTDLQVSVVSETLRVSSSGEVRNRRAVTGFPCILLHLWNRGLPLSQFTMVLRDRTQHNTKQHIAHT